VVNTRLGPPAGVGGDRLGQHRLQGATFGAGALVGRLIGRFIQIQRKLFDCHRAAPLKINEFTNLRIYESTNLRMDEWIGL
jgi:hypothetical protein